MTRIDGIGLLAVPLSAILILVPPVFAGATFQALGDLPGGVFESIPWSISADGSVVVGTSVSASGLEAFRWTRADGMVGLGYMPASVGPMSGAGDVSADGSVIVGEGTYGLGISAFRWTETDGMVPLAGTMSGGARGVSSDGSVIVGLLYFPGQAFRWTESTGTIPLGYLSETIPFPFSYASDVSADGSVVVGHSVNSGSAIEAFRWTQAEGMMPLGDLGNSYSVAEAVSADGSVIVGFDGFPPDMNRKAFRWTEADGMVDLGYGRAMDAQALDVSADGTIVVGGYDGGPYGRPWEAFIWDEINGMRSLQHVLTTEYGLDLTGWLLVGASSISADGLTIAGQGSGPHGSEAWVVTLRPVPVPGAALLGAVGLGLVGWLRRRRVL